MNITINTDVLQDYHLSLGDFLVLLMGYYDVDYKQCCDKLVGTGIASKKTLFPLSSLTTVKTMWPVLLQTAILQLLKAR